MSDTQGSHLVAVPRMVRLSCWCAARTRRRIGRRWRSARSGRREIVRACPDGLLECAAELHPAQQAEQIVKRRAQQWREQGARHVGIGPHAAWRAKGEVYAHRLQGCRAQEWQMVLGKASLPQCSNAAAVVCCNAAWRGMLVEWRAWHHAVFTRWRIGWCMHALHPRATGVAPGGVQMSVAGKRDAILLSRLGAFLRLESL